MKLLYIQGTPGTLTHYPLSARVFLYVYILYQRFQIWSPNQMSSVRAGTLHAYVCVCMSVCDTYVCMHVYRLPPGHRMH